MLLVSTYIMYSEINGFGLFATDDIDEGTIIWKWNSLLDKVLPKKEVRELPQHIKDFIYKYSAEGGDNYYLYFDNYRFINHSDKPNTIFKQKKMKARKDIKSDEEITQTYT